MTPEQDELLGRLALDAIEDEKALPALRAAAASFIIEGQAEPFYSAIMAGAWALRLREVQL